MLLKSVVPAKVFPALRIRIIFTSLVAGAAISPLTGLAIDIEGAQRSVVVVNTDQGHGSGVLIDSSGVVVTNLHVIENAEDISVKIYSDERFEDVSVIDFDETKDIALLKIKGFDLPKARLGNSNDIKSGQDVYAIGAPRGLEQTVSRGIVSAIRVMDGGFKAIQTDASISPGSSGGGLFNEASELVAVLTAFRVDGQNLNFAVPVNYVRGMMNQPVRYSESEFVALHLETPPFGEASNVSDNSKKLLRWVKQLTADDEDLKWEQRDEDTFVVTFNGLNILIKRYNSLLWITMPVGPMDDMSERALSRWLKLSREIDYAYVALDDDNELSVAYEMHIDGSSYKAFEQGFWAVPLGVRTLLNETDEVDTSLSANQKPPVEKNTDTNGLRYVEPGMLGIQMGYRAFIWNAEAGVNDDGYTLNTKRGESKWAKVYVERLELTSDYNEGLDGLMTNYLDGVEGVSVQRRGFRQVQSFPAVWAEYSASVEGLRLYYSTTSVWFDKRLVTLHCWSLEPEWEVMDQTSQEFLSNLVYR